MMKWFNFGATLEYDINPNRAMLSAQTSKFVEKQTFYKYTFKNDRRNSGGTLRQKETKRRQTES